MARRSGARRDSELKLRLAMRAARLGIWDWNVATGEMDYSPRARAMFGFSPDETVTFEKVRDATHPDDLPRTSAMARRALDPEVRAKEPYEYRIRRADTGEVRWALAHGEAVFAEIDGAPKAIRYVGTIEDITERKKTEEALRDSELRQRLAIESASMAIWEVDLASDTITGSPELNRIFGLPPEANPTIEELRSFYAPGERERVREAGVLALQDGKTQFEVEFRIRQADGSLRWILLRAAMLFAPDGRVERVIGVLMDIDARKRGEERQALLLRELNHRVKNSLSVVQAIAKQTFRSNRAEPEALQAFQSRLRALAKANGVLLDGEFMSFGLADLIEGIVEPYRDPTSRIAVSGENVSLPPRLSVPLALVVHELCTNAAKYGALSVPDGYVHLDWSSGDRVITLSWSEHGGPPPAEDFSKGFGMRLITETLAAELGRVELAAEPTGMTCRITMQV